jgi:ferredoxin
MKENSMKRKVIKIDEDLCNGCGLCAQACHEGAIGMIDGKAHLLRDDYCDGLGNCLPVCPTGAITFEEREAAEYDQVAVDQHLKNLTGTAPAPAAEKVLAPSRAGCPSSSPSPTGGCPGSRPVTLGKAVSTSSATAPIDKDAAPAVSQLMQWPVQIKLLPLHAPYYEGAHLLIAADCAAFASGDFHDCFMKNKITMIGCPKLDEGSYAEKLTAILEQNNIASVTVVRMEVPCCGGLANAAIEALKNCGKMIPWNVVTLSVRGEVIS